MSDLDFHDGSGREGATAVIGVAPRLVGCIISKHCGRICDNQIIDLGKE